MVFFFFELINLFYEICNKMMLMTIETLYFMALRVKKKLEQSPQKYRF
jgi:hypothetical protein